MMSDSTSVWILADRPVLPIYHRFWRRNYTYCNQNLSLGFSIRLGHARKFGRPCKQCWSADEAPRPLAPTTTLLWQFG